MKIIRAMDDTAKGRFSRESIDKWHRNYRKLETFSKQNGFAPGEPEEDLARWVDTQRSVWHMLPGELKEKLEALDFDFENKGNSWEAMYRQLAGFVEKNGHVCLPDDRKHEAFRDWLNRQILSKRLLSESQFQRLDRLGVDWDTPLSRDQRWEQKFLRLKGFHDTFGHCRVPQRWAKDKPLALWVTVQRRRHAEGKLLEDRHRMLSEVGFTWDIKTQYDAQWERYFQQLLSFRQRHGHCRVPGRHEKLVSWIERQRLARAKSLLSDAREDRLNKIGFIWGFDKIKRENWEERYRQLREYKRKHGHSFVPVNCKGNKPLGIWVATQRGLEAKGKLGAAKKKKLSELGFVWYGETRRQLESVYDSLWETSFGKLKAYRQKHGACQVSLKIDPVLQRWTRWQRILFYQGKLSAERIDRLNEIRFPWSVQEGYWMRMYAVLTSFRDQFGHTRVPSQWEPNPQLAAWVYKTKLSRSKLTPQKIELLNGIGFDWTLRRKIVVPWGEMYGRLVAFRQEQGHTRVPVRWHEDPKLGKWVSRMRCEREKLDPKRVSLLEAIGFEWGYRSKTREINLYSTNHLSSRKG